MKTTTGIIIGLSAYALASGFLTLTRTERDNKDIKNQLKEEVKQYNMPVKDFEAIQKNAKASGSEILTWQKALDSLATKAKIEKAYLEGAQMVRDSIKTASKSIK